MSESQTIHPLLAERDSLISAYEKHAQAKAAGRETPTDPETGKPEHYAVNAGRSRKIAALQVQMLLAGLAPTERDSEGNVTSAGDFDEWNPTRTSKPTVSAEDLFAEIKRLHSAVANSSVTVNGRTVKLTASMTSAFETQCDAKVLSALRRADIEDSAIPVPVKYRERVKREADEKAAKRAEKKAAKS